MVGKGRRKAWRHGKIQALSGNSCRVMAVEDWPEACCSLGEAKARRCEGCRIRLAKIPVFLGTRMLELPPAPPPQSAKTAPVAGQRHAGSEGASGFVDHLQDAFDRSRPERPQPKTHDGKGASRPTSIARPISEPRASSQAIEREDEASVGTDLAVGSEGGLASGVNPSKAETSGMPGSEAGHLPSDTAVNAQAEAATGLTPWTDAQMNALQAGSRPAQVAAADQAQVVTSAIMRPDQALRAAEAEVRTATLGALPINPAPADARMAALPNGEAQQAEMAAKALAQALSPGADETMGPAASLVQAAAKDGSAPAAVSGKTPLAAIRADAETPKPADPASLLLRAITAATAARDVGQEPAKMAEWVAPAAGLLAPQLPGAEERAEVPQGPAPVMLPMDAAHRQAEAVLHSQAARDAAPPPPPTRQLAPVVVSMALGRGDESLTIALDPETLALLQRDQRELDRALSQAGLGDLSRSIAFSLASDQGRQREQGGGQDKGKRSVGLVLGADGDRLIAPVPVQQRLSTSLIDLAV
jgi:flagellar hook-length control protein FliK